MSQYTIIMKIILSLMFLWQIVSYKNIYQTKIVNIPISPFLKIQHHIILVTKNKDIDKMKDVYIFDYSPQAKLNPFIILILVIGCNVPSEIRISHFTEISETTLIDELYKKRKLPNDFRKVFNKFNNENNHKLTTGIDDNVDKIINKFYKPYNLYTNNCQSFSKYFVSNINKQTTKPILQNKK